MNVTEFPGIVLSDRDIKQKKVLFTEWQPNLKYAWDGGIAMSRFLLELKRGKIIGTKCDKCGRVMTPPRVFCELCFKPFDDWVYLEDTGVIITWGISYIDWDASRISEPVFPAVIGIDGASEGVGFMHMLGEIEPDPAKIKVGMRVKAVWKPSAEREGAITDIKYFKPI
jgi:hypothetical protein